MANHLRLNGWRKDRSSNVTADDSLPADYGITKPSNLIEITGFNFGRFRFFGAGSADETATIEIWAVETEYPTGQPRHSGVPSPVVYYSQPIVSVVVTAGASTGVANTTLVATDLIVDGIALTTRNSAALIPFAPSGAVAAVYAPADDVRWGELVISNFGGADWITLVYTNMGGGGSELTNVNCLYNLVTQL